MPYSLVSAVMFPIQLYSRLLEKVVFIIDALWYCSFVVMSMMQLERNWVFCHHHSRLFNHQLFSVATTCHKAKTARNLRQFKDLSHCLCAGRPGLGQHEDNAGPTGPTGPNIHGVHGDQGLADEVGVFRETCAYRAAICNDALCFGDVGALVGKVLPRGSRDRSKLNS